MSMRGGCGYVEEWSDPRVVRDAHLGSIWEGTSNVVALDVLRAINRDGALPALRAHNEDLLQSASLDAAARPSFLQFIERTHALADHAARNKRHELAREAASALYHITTAVRLAREAVEPALRHRLALAQMVLTHQLQARDPLTHASDDDHTMHSLLNESMRSPALQRFA